MAAITGYAGQASGVAGSRNSNRGFGIQSNRMRGPALPDRLDRGQRRVISPEETQGGLARNKRMGAGQARNRFSQREHL